MKELSPGQALWVNAEINRIKMIEPNTGLSLAEFAQYIIALLKEQEQDKLNKKTTNKLNYVN